MRLDGHRRGAPWVGIALLWVTWGLGCSVVRPSGPAPGGSGAVPGTSRPGEAPCDVHSLLIEATRLESLTSAGLETELAAAKASFERSRGVCSRFRVALLAVGSENRRNAGYSADLMEEYLLTAPAESDLRGLAQVLLRAFREQIAADTRLRSANRKVAEEQARSDTLRRQVEELKNIEKIIEDREKR